MTSRGNLQFPSLFQPAPAILILLALGGTLLSVYAGRREALQHAAIERLRLAEAADVHFGAVQDHLIARETLAATVAALFSPPPLETPRALGEFGKRVIAMAPEIATVGWLPEVAPERANEAMKSLIEAAVERPRFVGSDGRSVQPELLGRPLYPIIDVAPERNRRVIGVEAGSFPDRLAAIRQARETGNVVRTSPLRLVQAPGDSALLLYAPVYGKDGVFAGVMGFGYRVEQLFEAALTAPKGGRNFRIAVFTQNVNEPLFVLPAEGGDAANSGPAGTGTDIRRTMQFGGKPLEFSYSTESNPAQRGSWRGFLIAASGLTLTAAVISLLGLLANRASSLAREVGSRRSAEDRLKVLIHELNHRVRNVMSIAQAVIRLSFTSGASLPEIQKICEGRLQALANAMSLLTASDWRSVSFRRLISDDILPFAERIKTSGPDIALKPRSAQTFALLLYELAANAAKHGALSVANGSVALNWEIEGSGDDAVFRLNWRESGGPTTVQPTRRGFGELLVRRIAPRDLAGRSKVNYAAGGFEYEIEAPLRELVDTPKADPVSS